MSAFLIRYHSCLRLMKPNVWLIPTDSHASWAQLHSQLGTAEDTQTVTEYHLPTLQNSVTANEHACMTGS